MSVVQLNTEFPGSEWKRAFADELIRRVPDINPDKADELADAAFVRHHHRSPSCTAAEYAEKDNAGSRLRGPGPRGRAVGTR